uniref:hypothetical protein n=1 Tax=Yoonia sp. TaxID=2212373 RepID=UPI0040489DF7|tara:strand:+ start:1342 stop:1650 length:309 start_codon:yes stop_codon:yes gene_type:complete
MAEIGDLVIFGECDAPEAHCIGRITSKVGGIWHGKYLSKRTLGRYSGELRDSMVTPLSDFGVSVTINGKSLSVDRVRPTIATYSDGVKRDWQEHLPVTIRTP